MRPQSHAKRSAIGIRRWIVSASGAALVAGCMAARPAAPVIEAAGPPGDLAAAWYALANRWIAAAPPAALRPPEDLADTRCAYYLGPGTGERDVRGAAYLAFIYATLGSTGPYDEGLSGIPRGELVPAAERLLRWLGHTYPRWQGQWQSAMWAAIAAQGAWLVWDRLEADTQALVRAMICGEADRFVGRRPPARLDRDTKAEENAWNSMAPVMAACLFPYDRRVRRWERAARRYMLSAYLRPADLARGGRVSGLRLASFAGANVFDDFSLENHGFFHPDYLACVSITMTNALPHRLAGRRLPAALTYNARPIVALLTRLSTPDGGSYYPSGQDWETLRRVMYAKVFAQAAVLLESGDAAAVERLCLRAAERLQGRFDSGAFYAPDERRYFLAEELAASNCAWLFLFHTAFGEGAEPTPPAVLAERLRGAAVLPDGRLGFNRTADAFASFSWGGRVMAYWTPHRADVEVPPALDAFLGRVRTAGQSKTIKRTERGRARVMGRDLAVVASIWRDDARAVRQDVAFFALADGRTVYLERLVAATTIELTEAATGVVYPPLPRAGYSSMAGLLCQPAEAWQAYSGLGGEGRSANQPPTPRTYAAGEGISQTAVAVGGRWSGDRFVLIARRLDLIQTGAEDVLVVRDGPHLMAVNFGGMPAAVTVPPAPDSPSRISILPYDVFLWSADSGAGAAVRENPGPQGAGLGSG